MADHTGGWPERRPLSEAITIDGALSITVIDRLARATVWSMAFAPGHPHAAPDPAAEGIDGDRQVRIADDVLDTVRAVEYLTSAPGTDQSWFEVILIDASHYHILRPFGPADDALVIELVLDARSANLAAARQRFEELAPASSVTATATVSRADPAPVPDPPIGPGGLPRRIAAGPHDGVRPEPDRLVEEHILNRVAAALRTEN